MLKATPCAPLVLLLSAGTAMSSMGDKVGVAVVAYSGFDMYTGTASHKPHT